MQFGDEIVPSLTKSIGHSPRRPNLHFTKQNLVTPPSHSEGNTQRHLHTFVIRLPVLHLGLDDARAY